MTHDTSTLNREWPDYLWPVMDVITSDEGPLWNYNATRQREVPPAWEHEPAPNRYFTEEDSRNA